jgi:Calx-beta domain
VDKELLQVPDSDFVTPATNSAKTVGFAAVPSNPRGAKIARGEGYVTILDNEPRISISDAWASEGNSGATLMTFTVSLSAPYDLPVTVHYATSDASAGAGSDYTAVSGSVTVEPGKPNQPFTVTVNGDRLGEPDETFAVSLDTPSGYAEIARSAGIGTVVDDEPHISISDAWQDYYGSSITFTVSLSTPYDQAVTVDFTTCCGTASADGDYVSQSGTLRFEPDQPTSQMITVQLLVPDPADKNFSIQLSNATTNSLITNEWATGYWYYDYGYYDCGCGGYDYYYYWW